MTSRITQNPRYAAILLRASLGLSFLSAVAGYREAQSVCACAGHNVASLDI
jgi:hypothetical protein